ncbi:D-alanine--D-alanine ligase [Hoeflea marina]|uniref:D-alanine--D-alanine ligase n=1 Tax=Hoeflea marina TaxID=274592 RepID=A0A317PGM1_9HYPH|nr:D-alanine--D-alanine ligase [Hoeflea marina]PWV98282.1 D-alanine--D-alanine ligase [Hoeflea marina]
MTEITILFGGHGAERLVSVASAQNLASHAPDADLWFWQSDDHFIPVSHAELAAHRSAFEIAFEPTSKPLARSIDEALERAQADSRLLVLGLHGVGAEDGALALDCERRLIPFTGSGSAAGASGFDKQQSKLLAAARGVPVAPSLLICAGADGSAAAGFLQLHGPLVGKPVASGSSHGLIAIRDPSGLDLLSAASAECDYMLEPFVSGREFTVGVSQIDGVLRGLPPVEIVLDPDVQFDYSAKYLGRGCQEICPADIPDALSGQLQSLALAAHAAIGAYGYSRTDLIVGPDGPVFLEINTLPGLSKASLIPQALAAAGVPFSDFLSEQIELARRRYG